GLQPVRREVPLLAVPGVDAGPVGALVIRARRADRAHHAFEPERVQFRLRQVQVLQPPAGPFAAHPLAFAEALLGGANTLHSEHRADHAAHVKHLADFFLRSGPLAFAMDLLEDFLDDGGLRLGTVLERDAVISFGTLADVLDVRLGRRPPDAVHLFTWITGGLGFLDGGRVHHTPAPEEHIVRLVLADLKPGGLLLDAG